jgi:hypothetical protein
LWIYLADGITSANAARIKPGMPLKEVNRLLGHQGQYVNELMPNTTGENHYVWDGSLGAIHVAFRGDLTAADPTVFVPEDSIKARLRRMLP